MPTQDWGRLNDSQWEYLIARIANDSCTPIIGPGTSSNWSREETMIVHAMAQEFAYPFPGQPTLEQVSQFIDSSYTERFFNEVMRKRAKYKDDIETRELYQCLARLPLSVYLTTNSDDLLETALMEAGKSPFRFICPWWNLTDTPEIDSRISIERPLVFYLHGHNSEPRSVVLTEDNYLDFLMNISGNSRLIPNRIQSRLIETLLLFTGYNHADWRFRILAEVLQHRSSFVRGSLCVSFASANEEISSERHLFNLSLKALRIEPVFDTVWSFSKELMSRLDSFRKEFES